MKIMITMILSASFIAASSGTAEEGLMKAIAQIDNTPKPLISVRAINRPVRTQHVRELHGDFVQPRELRSKSVKHEQRLAKFKAMLRKQKQARLAGLSGPQVTSAY